MQQSLATGPGQRVALRMSHIGLYVADQMFDLWKVASEIALRLYLTIGFVALLGLIALVLSLPLVVVTFLTPYRLSRDKFYFDEIYSALVVWPLRMVAAACYWIDRWIVDGSVDLVGRIPPAIGYVMRGLQMGLLQFYALAMVLGMLILVAARLLWAA